MPRFRDRQYVWDSANVSIDLSDAGRSICAIACAIVLAASCAAAEIVPQELTVDGNGGAIAVTRYAAEGTAARPAVLVLHGAGGLDVGPQAYARQAVALAEVGIDAYLVRYFGRGDRSCGCWEVWAETVAAVMTAILRRPEASGRVGLLGFSLGGAVAVTGARDPRIAALVVFYGFVPNRQRARIDRLPPLLVLHGDADDDVPLSSGQDIVALARQLGGRAELVVYRGVGHRTSTWGEAAATDAINRTVAFLRAELNGP
jgi:carboxymethylenebutenolidase